MCLSTIQHTTQSNPSVVLVRTSTLAHNDTSLTSSPPMVASLLTQRANSGATVLSAISSLQINYGTF